MSSFPKIKTLQSWKNDFSWLQISPSEGMKCTLCIKWEKKISSSKNYSEAFIAGSKNYRRSAVSEHAKTSQHELSKDLEDKESCEKEGQAYRKKVKQV